MLQGTTRNTPRRNSQYSRDTTPQLEVEKSPGWKPTGGFVLGVTDGARTRDTQDHNLVLYQLNYSHHRCNKAARTMLGQMLRTAKTPGQTA